MLAAFLVRRREERRGGHKPIELQLLAYHHARSFFRLQAPGERESRRPVDRVRSCHGDRLTFITPDRSDEEEIRRQTVPFGHETTNTVEFRAVITHQVGVIDAEQQLTRLKLLAAEDFF